MKKIVLCCLVLLTRYLEAADHHALYRRRALSADAGLRRAVVQPVRVAAVPAPEGGVNNFVARSRVINDAKAALLKLGVTHENPHAGLPVTAEITTLAVTRVHGGGRQTRVELAEELSDLTQTVVNGALVTTGSMHLALSTTVTTLPLDEPSA